MIVRLLVGVIFSVPPPRFEYNGPVLVVSTRERW
jgi:hypothetical protein